MNILVQKFGGTSVATEESREAVYKKIEIAAEKGYAMVIVISAMGRVGDPYATDTLLNLLIKQNENVSKRELDMAFICGEIISGALVTSAMQKKGYDAVYLTGEQAGIITDGVFTDSRVINVKTDKIKALLEQGKMVIVAGGQGISEDMEYTSLGRGGSDTTACVLGVALGAQKVEIYTDVDGFMTADPRKVKDAKLLEAITHENCINMAYSGAKVMNARAVEEAAKNKEMPLYIKNTFSEHEGTVIGDFGKLDIPKAVGIAGGHDRISIIGTRLTEINLEEKALGIMRANEFKAGTLAFDDNVLTIATEPSVVIKAMNILHEELI